MNIHDIYSLFMRHFRPRRLEKFRRLFPEKLCGSIIDMGGSRYWWDQLKYGSKVTILNIDIQEANSNDIPTITMWPATRGMQIYLTGPLT